MSKLLVLNSAFVESGAVTTPLTVLWLPRGWPGYSAILTVGIVQFL